MSYSAASSTKRESHPITILDSDLAGVFTHLHPFLVLSWYALQFNAVVADPVSTLSSILLPLGATQILYTMLCLPAVGTSAKSSGTSKASKKRVEAGMGKRMTTAAFSTLLSLLLGTPLITCILILFGAPVTTHLPHTILCAAHISLLAALPLIYVHGVDKGNWRRAGALMLPVDEVFGASAGTLFGAWAGAVPIPLDWDREWQKWPVTIVTGAYIGWALGKLAGKYIFHGKIIDLSA